MTKRIKIVRFQARVALLEYMTSLLDEYTEPGASINVKELKTAIRKMFTWVGDQRQSILLTPYIEKAICSMFCVNVADFSALISDFDADQKAWIHQTLQRNGLENGIRFVGSSFSVWPCIRYEK